MTDIVKCVFDTVFVFFKIGKGLNIWDEYTHRNPSPIDDESDGDIACDSYHKIDADVEILKDMGVRNTNGQLL